MKKLSAAVALAVATLATPAMAAPCISTTSVDPNTCSIDYTPNVGGTFGNTDPRTFTGAGTNFRDVFGFITQFARSATVDITSSYPTGDLSQNVNFISNGVKLDAQIIEVITSGQNERRMLANFRLPAGTHEILVRGSSGPNGVYNGILSLSGVPEPTTWALMIVGIGFAGGALRRRQRQTAKIAFA